MNIKNTAKEKGYWNDFYDNFFFDIPSQFCTLMATEVETNTSIVEFGCGNGRDSIFLARHGYTVIAMDLSSEAIKFNTDKAIGLENICFFQGNVTNHIDVSQAIDASKEDNNNNIIIYTRFFLHTLDQDQENKFMKSLSEQLNSGDKIYFEFRPKEDADANKIYGHHYRRFIDTEKFLDDLNRLHKFSVNYHITGQGMAKYKSEDPYITRVIAEKI